MNIRKLFSNRRMVVSLAIVALVAAGIIGGTIAYFSDTETSLGNTFKAGKFNLKIDNTCHYNGKVCILDPTGSGKYYWQGTTEECFCTWELKDLTGELYFNFLDVKPGDNGEDTISLHVDNNLAWICAEIANLVKDDNGCEKPESDIDTTCGAGQGELQDNLFFTIWKDNGAGDHACNNVKDGDETYLIQDQPAQAGYWPIADSLNGTPLQGDTTYCLGVKWNVPITAGNEIQTDSLVGDVIFRAVQSRNMDTFKCSDLYTEVCDGKDNDYDGAVDEGWDSLGQSCNVGVGACQQLGVYVCNINNSSGPEVCSAVAGTPTEEICLNGIDDDCDGTTDTDCACVSNSDCNDGNSLTIDTCNQQNVCSYSNLDLCDGVDENGDGIDGENESWLGEACDGTDSDLCKEGAYVCQAGAKVCNDNTTNSTDYTCNGVDDNCNGKIDDGGGLTAANCGCYWIDPSMVATQKASPETCNSKDDNCNEAIDEGLTMHNYYKDFDNDGYAINDYQNRCGPIGWYDVYPLGQIDCNDSNSSVHPNATEVCNGIDDNCNGQIDESFPEQGSTCAYVGPGAWLWWHCTAGVLVCQ